MSRFRKALGLAAFAGLILAGGLAGWLALTGPALLRGHAAPISIAVLSTDAKRLWSWDSKNRVTKLWDVASRLERVSLDDWDVWFSPDCSLLATRDNDASTAGLRPAARLRLAAAWQTLPLQLVGRIDIHRRVRVVKAQHDR
jgi:hypothetical protein